MVASSLGGVTDKLTEPANPVVKLARALSRRWTLWIIAKGSTFG